MKDFYVYIDDSGSPGQLPVSKYQSPDSKLWAAVILCLEEKELIEKILKLATRELQHNISFSEFHFTDIYSGRNEFKGIDSKLRLEIFDLLVELYNSIRPYVIVTSAGQGTLEKSGFSEAYIKKKENGFKFCNPGDYALNTLLLFINEYFIDNYEDDNIRVEITIDEGRQKANTIQKVTDSFGICNELNYKSSTNEYGLQFIDFIAFSINRIQNNFSKNRSDFDNEFMRIVGKLQLNSNLNMIKVSGLEELDKHRVESFMEGIGKASIESIKYIEELSEYNSKMREAISKNKLDSFNIEILRDIKKLNQSHSNIMSDEFKSFLNNIERHLSDKF